MSYKSNDDKANDIFHKLTKSYSDSKKSIISNLSNNDSIPNQAFQEQLGRSQEFITGDNIVKTQPRMQVIHKKLEPRNLENMVEPDQLSELSEQLQLITQDLISKIKNSTSESTIKYTYEWIEGIIDVSHGELYPNIRKAFSELSKEELIDYIEMLLLSSY